MEIKEVLIRVIEKMNCKEMLKEHNVWCSSRETFSEDQWLTDLGFELPHPVKSDPSNTVCKVIRFICDRKSFGFAGESSHKIDYPCTEKEAVEIKYLFHQIKNKLEEIWRDELLELL